MQHTGVALRWEAALCVTLVHLSGRLCVPCQLFTRKRITVCVLRANNVGAVGSSC